MLRSVRRRALQCCAAGADRHRRRHLLLHRRPGTQDRLRPRRANYISARGTLPVHRELYRRPSGRDAEHLLCRGRSRRRCRRSEQLRARRCVTVGVDVVRTGRRLRDPAASGRRHSADRTGAVSRVEDVAQPRRTRAFLYRGDPGAGDLARAARALDHSQLARLSSLPAAGSAVGQRSRRVHA